MESTPKQRQFGIGFWAFLSWLLYLLLIPTIAGIYFGRPYYFYTELWPIGVWIIAIQITRLYKGNDRASREVITFRSVYIAMGIADLVLGYLCARAAADPMIRDVMTRSQLMAAIAFFVFLFAGSILHGRYLRRMGATKKEAGRASMMW